jgi:hypothetical protein
MNNESERMRKEIAESKFKVPSLNLSGGTEENNK